MSKVVFASLVATALARGPPWDPRLPVPEFQVNLDQPPELRFAKVIEHFNSSIWNFYTGMHLHNFVVTGLANKIAKARGPEPEEFMREIEGIAKATNIPVNAIHTIQMLYEINTLMVPIVNITWPWDAEDRGMYALEAKNWTTADEERPLLGPLRFGCTGIIATDPNDGSVYHARNLDFSFAKYLQALTYTGVFTKGGKEVFRAQTIAAYPSVLTGMRKGPNGYTIEINTRFLDHWGGNKQMFHNLFTEKRNLSGWSKRKILENVDNYEEAVDAFSTTPYVASEYNIIAGVKKGIIIGRNPDGPAYTIPLNKSKYIIMTNFDYVYHDIREWFDPTGGKGIFHPRRQAAQKILDAASAITPDVLFSTLNNFEVMAKDTIFQMIANPEKGLWNVSLPACTACGRSDSRAFVVV